VKILASCARDYKRGKIVNNTIPVDNLSSHKIDYRALKENPNRNWG
jgi:hypothetical protein